MFIYTNIQKIRAGMIFLKEAFYAHKGIYLL